MSEVEVTQRFWELVYLTWGMTAEGTVPQPRHATGERDGPGAAPPAP